MALITEERKMAGDALFNAAICYPMGGNGGRDFWFSLGR